MGLPLDGITVIELGSMVAAPYAGKLLAELGADVVKLEPPGAGDPARLVGPFPRGVPDPETSALFLYLNTAKRSVELDPATADGRATLDRLLDRADVLIHDATAVRAATLGIDPETVLARYPRLIGCAVTPFGLTGPYAELPGTDLTLQALGGYMLVTGEPGRQPLMGFGHQAQYQAGIQAAIGVLALLEAREATGQVDYLDLSILEATGATFEARVAWHTTMGVEHVRMGNRLARHGPLVDLYPTFDGRIAIAPQAEHQWEGLCVALGHPEWRDDPAMSSWEKRAVSPELDAGVRRWFQSVTTAEAIEQLQVLRVPSALVLGCAGVLSDPQVQERRVFEEIDHPRAGRLPYAARTFLAADLEPRVERAPLLGEHNGYVATLLDEGGGEAVHAPAASSPSPAVTRKPLSHILVLDITQAYAGPFGGEILAGLGAEVIHVESHIRPDVARFIHPVPVKNGHAEDGGAYFSQHNQGKLGVNLNLGHERGREIFLRLVPQVDAILNNFSARVMDNWGFTFERLSALNPGLVTVGMPSFGATGPQSGWVCYGEALEAATGLVQARGYGPNEPIRSGVAYPDAVGGVTAAHALMAGLAYRRRTGRGVAIDLSQRDGGIRLMGEAFLAFAMNGEEAAQCENEHPQWVPHRAYRAAGEDRWITIVARDDPEWRSICGVIGRPELAIDPRYATGPARLAARAEVDRLIEDWSLCQEPHDAQARLMAVGVPAGVVLTTAELIANEQLAARRFYPEVDHPAIGRHRVHAMPHRLVRAELREPARAPLFDEHTREVLRRLAGVDDAEYADLVALGVTGQRPKFIDHS